MGQEAGKTLPRVVAVEWIPLRANSTVLEAYTKAQGPSKETPQPVERVTARGDEQELADALEKLAADKPDVIIGFGDHVCQAVRAKLPQVPLLAMLARRPELLTTKSPAAPLAILDSEPAPEQIWALARQLRPDAAGLGVLYTREYEPNKRLAASLSRVARFTHIAVSEITVAEGYCRTDSDFERALCGEGKEKPSFDILFVPDDPNGSRFGDVIYAVAARLGKVSIGTETTVGKGCAAALTPDYEALGREARRLCGGAVRDMAWPDIPIPIPCKIMFDEVVLRKQGLKPGSQLVRDTTISNDDTSEKK